MIEQLVARQEPDGQSQNFSAAGLALSLINALIFHVCSGINFFRLRINRAGEQSLILNQGLLDLLDQHLSTGLIVERHSHPTGVHSPLLDSALRQAPGHL